MAKIRDVLESLRYAEEARAYVQSNLRDRLPAIDAAIQVGKPGLASKSCHAFPFFKAIGE